MSEIEYHTRDYYDEEGNIVRTELILDCDGEPIPKSVCLCHAYEPNECCCGAWDDVKDWDYE